MKKPTLPHAIISDIHGNRWALEAVLEDIQRRGIEKMVNLGDCFYGPLDPKGTADILLELNIPTISGNEDRIIVEPVKKIDISHTLEFVRQQLSPHHLQWLKQLDMTKSIDETFFMFHSSPISDHEYLMVEVTECKVQLRQEEELTAALSQYNEKIFLCGHDHIPRTLYLTNGKLLVNPGSVGLPAYTDDLPYFHTMETGTPHARYSTIHHNGKGWLIENIAVPYNCESAANAALKHNRPDWAKWLLTGRG
jgi:putative phosphoesterase